MAVGLSGMIGALVEHVRWGILGTGAIARQFADGVRRISGGEIRAVGSRNVNSAEHFGEEFDIPVRHASYEDLASDPEIDVVYVATPHALHENHAAMCLDKGKGVLCEKPLTVNASEARRLIQLARRKGCFLMEGMWTRFFPLMERVRELIGSGAIGEPRMLTADFGYRQHIDAVGRKFNAELGGGALLDVGVYCIALASMVFGRAREVTGATHVGQTSVDEQSAAILKYEDGQLAVLSAAIRTQTPQEATVAGTEGTLRIHSPWWKPRELTLSKPGKEDYISRLDYDGNGFAHEASEVERCVDSGLKESSIMPLDESLSIIETMDTLRTLWDLRYPTD